MSQTVNVADTSFCSCEGCTKAWPKIGVMRTQKERQCHHCEKSIQKGRVSVGVTYVNRAHRRYHIRCAPKVGYYCGPHRAIIRLRAEARSAYKVYVKARNQADRLKTFAKRSLTAGAIAGGDDHA